MTKIVEALREEYINGNLIYNEGIKHFKRTKGSCKLYHNDKKDDFMPPRLLEPLPLGPIKGRNGGFDSLYGRLHGFYKWLDWSLETGIPTRRSLENLMFGFVADDLEKFRRLPKETL